MCLAGRTALSVQWEMPLNCLPQFAFRVGLEIVNVQERHGTQGVTGKRGSLSCNTVG
jgi:hypothetical protein